MHKFQSPFITTLLDYITYTTYLCTFFNQCDDVWLKHSNYFFQFLNKTLLQTGRDRISTHLITRIMDSAGSIFIME